jgi:uncharacterized PurR-regulated membrane protein YhhQ (DUF165 family)
MNGQINRLAAQGGVIISHAPVHSHWFVRGLHAAAILTPPAVAVVVTLVVAWQARDIPLTLFDGILSPWGRPDLYPSHWLSLGHAVVPVVFLIANLVNRRYGEDLAIGHVLLSWLLVVATAIVLLSNGDQRIVAAGQAPAVRVAAAFFGAMAIGQLAGAFVFDRTRGINWWNAPLYSALTSSFVATFLFYVVAYAGTDWIWLNHMSVDAGVKAAMSFALLVPYMLLRHIIRPLGGFGGY